mgnify:CR=1 FL=1
MYEPPKRRKLTKAEREKVYALCDGHCAYCGAYTARMNMQIDHVIPMQFYECYHASGFDLDSMDNFLPACRSCNHYKSALTLEKFRAAIENYPYVLARDSTTYLNAVRFGVVTPTPKKVQFYFETQGIQVPSLGWR